MKLVTIVGIRFKRAGKIYYFSPGEYDLAKGDHAIVETARGIEYGEVVIPRQEVEELRKRIPGRWKKTTEKKKKPLLSVKRKSQLGSWTCIWSM